MEDEGRVEIVELENGVCVCVRCGGSEARFSARCVDRGCDSDGSAAVDRERRGGVGAGRCGVYLFIAMSFVAVVGHDIGLEGTTAARIGVAALDTSALLSPSKNDWNWTGSAIDPISDVSLSKPGLGLSVPIPVPIPPSTSRSTSLVPLLLPPSSSSSMTLELGVRALLRLIFEDGVSALNAETKPRFLQGVGVSILSGWSSDVSWGEGGRPVRARWDSLLK